MKCVKNYQPGVLLGFDYRDSFEVGQSYVMIYERYHLLLWVPSKKKWVEVVYLDFCKMFEPEL